jgi:hypothetical protein
MKTRNMTILLIITMVILQTSFQMRPAKAAPQRSKEELLAAFKNLCEAHPTHASYVTIGKTIQNRSILAFRIGNPNGGAVMWDAALHGGEVVGGEIAYLVAKWVLENSTFDPNARRILERNYLIFIPVINMDTYSRQNMRRVYDFDNGTVVNIPYGVNLNRNFVYNWGESGTGNPDDANEYRGLYAGSEPETQAVRNALQTYRPRFYVNTHQGQGPWIGYWYESDRATANWVVDRISNMSSETDVSTYPVKQTGWGGMAVSDAYYSGSSSWLLELDDGKDWNPSLSIIQTTYFPKCLPIVRAMCEYCEVSTINYTIERDGRAFTVSIDSNCTVSNFMFNQTSGKIDFSVPRQQGEAAFCNVTFSTQLLEGPFRVLLDGSPIIPIEKSNSTHTSLYFTYTNNNHIVEITGTPIVSEFSTIAANVLVLAVLALMLLLTKRSYTGNKSHRNL